MLTDNAPRWRGVVRHLEYLGSDSFLFINSDADVELCVRVVGSAGPAGLQRSKQSNR